MEDEVKVMVQVPAPLPNLLSSSTLLLEIARVPAQVHVHFYLFECISVKKKYRLLDMDSYLKEIFIKLLQLYPFKI